MATHPSTKTRFGHVFLPRYRDPKTGEMRPSRYWCVAYRHRGKRTVVSSKSSDVKDAERLRWKIFADLWEDKLPWVKREPARFFEVLALVETDYIKNRRRSIQRLRGCLRVLRAFPPFQQQLPASSLTEDLWERYVLQRQAAGVENATINYERSVVLRAYRIAAHRLDAKGQPLVPRIPMLEKLKANPPKQGYFEPQQAVAIHSALLQAGEADIADLLSFYRVTGWRFQEPISLQWSQVDWFRKVVTLDRADSKSGEPWELPFDSNADLEGVLIQRRKRTKEAEAELALKGEKRAQGPASVPWVFHRGGLPIDRRKFYKIWRRACLAAGVSNRTPHDFRRTVARDLMDAGVDEILTCNIVGWKSLQMLQRYRIVRTGDRSRAMAKLQRFHKRQCDAREVLPRAPKKSARSNVVRLRPRDGDKRKRTVNGT